VLNLKFAKELDCVASELQIQKAHWNQSFLVWLTIPKFAESSVIWASINASEFRNRHTRHRLPNDPLASTPASQRLDAAAKPEALPARRGCGTE
jgi:hypothetical protein